MHNFLFILAIIILVSCGKDAETLDFIQVETESEQDLSSLDVIDDYIIVVGGDVFNQGITLQGKELNWNKQETFSDKRLFGIDCGAAQCTAVGQDGYFYQYTEEDQWKFVRLPYWDFQRAVSSTSQNTVTVSGKSFEDGSIMHINTANEVDTLITFEAQLQDVAAVDASTFIAVGYGTILRSIDGGYNWIHIDQEGDFYHGVDFWDEDHGIIVGQAGSILLSNDGGLTWNTIKKPASLSSNRAQFLSVKYINDTDIYIVGDEGLLWHSTDSGNSWQDFKVDTNHNLNDVAMLEEKLYVVGDNGYLAYMPL